MHILKYGIRNCQQGHLVMMVATVVGNLGVACLIAALSISGVVSVAFHLYSPTDQN